MRAIGGVVLMTAGVAFLLVAAIGLVRLRDPLQRMHGATKAGTIGTALILAGALLATDAARPATGLLTILFLLVTLPIGAQLLGRAGYVSGARLDGLEGEDPLAEILDRQDRPGDEPASGRG